MIRRSLAFAATVLLALNGDLSINAQSFFEQLPGPTGGDIHAIVYAMDGNPVCMTQTQIFRWDASQQRWDATQSFWVDVNPKAFYRAPDGTLFACAVSAGLYVSKDNGQSWQKDSGNPSLSKGVIATADGTLYHVGTGVQRSTDGGATWVERSTGMDDSDGKAILDIGGGEMLVAAHNSGIYRSTNAGMSWELLTGSPKRVRRLFRTSDGRVWAATGDEALVSSDKGGTWSQVGGGLTGGIGAFCEVPSGDLFACSLWARGGLFRSTDQGATWNEVSGVDAYCGRNDLACTSNGEISCADVGGVRSSTDNGDTWIQRNNGLNAVSIQGIGQTSTGILLCALEYGGVFRSSDHGQQWEDVSFPSTSPWLNLLVVGEDDAVYAASREYLHRSSDDGASWQHLNSNHMFQSCGDVLLRSPNTILVAEQGRLSWSGDQGATWELRGSGLPQSNVVAMLSLPDGGILAATYDEGIYKSNDDARTWLKTAGVGHGIRINKLAHRAPGTIFAATSGHGVYRSIDGGESWESITNGLNNRYIWALHVSPAGGVFAGSSTGVSYLEEATDTWVPLQGLGIRTISLLTDSRSLLLAGTHTDGLFASRTSLREQAPSTPTLLAPVNGSANTGTSPELSWSEVNSAVYYRIQVAEEASMTTPIIDSVVSVRGMLRISGLSTPHQYHWRISAGNPGGLSAWSETRNFHTGDVTAIQATITPERNVLFQNYPNPAHDFTDIAFDLGHYGHVELTIHTILGDKAYSLYRGYAQKGRHSIRINTATLPKGVYFYRLNTAEGSVVRTMTILR